MSLNSTASAERTHIGFFGMRNAGKSSVVNAVTGQNLAVVSDTLGTTTDSVRKAMELLPAGPVVIIDTPGIDDEGELGQKRVAKAKEELHRCDVAVLVVDAAVGLRGPDQELIKAFESSQIPYVVVFNKADLLEEAVSADPSRTILVSAETGEGIWELKERIALLAQGASRVRYLLGDLLNPGDLVVLVIPIDESAPKLRLIMPQQMVVRDCLDHHAIPICTQVEELEQALGSLGRKPAMVITDSQAFGAVSKLVPEDIPLTSFSILMARYKGNLASFVQGAAALAGLTDDSQVLVCESCSHHRQCQDIGTVKIPGWVREYAQANPHFAFTSGREFPDDLSGYDLVIHCGGCMSNAREMAHRMNVADRADVPMVNYGMGIAQMHGILKRSLELFPDVAALVE